MASLTDFFKTQNVTKLPAGIEQKNNILKCSILACMVVNGGYTVADLTKRLHVSVPTITKLLQELVDEGLVSDCGKADTPGGRRPTIYCLTQSTIYFVGVNVEYDHLNLVLVDMQNNMVKELTDHSFVLQDTPQCGLRLCKAIEDFIAGCGVDRGQIIGLGVCIVGRVNPTTGYSYRYFTGSDESMRDIITKAVGIRTWVEHTTRARCYAEYVTGKFKKEKNILYLHIGGGLAVGIIANGKLYYGKSGFAGELGHMPCFDNGITCWCGRQGCLETEASGLTLEKKCIRLIEQGENTMLREKYMQKEPIHIEDIALAAKNNDALSVKLLEEACIKIGKALAMLLNIFNPEVVIIGGAMSVAADCITLPLRAELEKYPFDMVYKDTKFRVSKLNDSANALGAAILVRNRIFDIK